MASINYVKFEVECLNCERKIPYIPSRRQLCPTCKMKQEAEARLLIKQLRMK